MKKHLATRVIACLLYLPLLVNATSNTETNAALAMPDSFSAYTVKQVLESGGNAIDAAIAAQFVLAVTFPEAGNIGGGGFMTIYKDGEANFLDYREVAPIKAHRDMYLDDKGEVIANLSVYGILSSGVPGTVDGMWKAHQKYGTKSWQTLLAPAIKLAEQGFTVHPKLQQAIEWRIKSFKNQGIQVNFSKHFAHAKAGTLFKQSALASSLKRIAQHGRDGFYQGKTAELFSQFMAKNGGIINEKDLANYQAVWRKPIVHPWRDQTIITAPPPSSGGIAILQWLTMHDLVKGNSVFAHNSKDYIHVLAEIGKRVFSDRAEYLGDPDFVDVPVTKLLNSDYLTTRIEDISLDKISVTTDINPGLKESTDTTHFSIIDKWGNAVSNTTTINYNFGSGVVIDQLGFILNDEMDDFSAKPGVANIYGAIGFKANEIQPNKRMLSSMTPTIMLKDGQVTLVTGAPGGTTIISSVYQSILNVVEYKMDAKQAVNIERFHHQLWPKDQIEYKGDVDDATLKALKDLGYKNTGDYGFGDLQLIIRSAGKYHAASENSNTSRGMALTLE